MIGDSVTALGVMIAFYYGLTGFACVWFYRHSLRESTRNLWVRGVIPLAGGLILWIAMFWFLWYNFVTPSNSYTTWTFPGTSRVLGGMIILDVGAIILGVVLMLIYRGLRPAYFRGEILTGILLRECPKKSVSPSGSSASSRLRAGPRSPMGPHGHRPRTSRLGWTKPDRQRRYRHRTGGGGSRVEPWPWATRPETGVRQ